MNRASYFAAAAWLAAVAGPSRLVDNNANGHRNQPAQAAWTVLLFINADNNLDGEVDQNLQQIIKLPTNPKVNFIAEIDRFGDGAHDSPGTWSNTIRIKVDQSLSGTHFDQLPTKAVENMPEQNMGDPATLRAFIDWGKAHYPADHYMLIVWNHGQGWRFTLTSTVAAMTKYSIASRSAAPGAKRPPRPPSPETPLRSISSDTHPMDQLYNSELAEGVSGSHLDIIGFDACLMAMMETGYAIRQHADYMVASEELEPGPGWNYTQAFGALAASATPGTVTPDQVGRMIVNGYAATYGDTDSTTLSLVDLRQMDAVAAALDVLSAALSKGLSANVKGIKASRDALERYGQGAGVNLYHVDAIQFADNLTHNVSDPAIVSAATATRGALQRAVLAQYASKLRRGAWASLGLAIYFAPSGTAYDNDEIAEHGYERSNQYYPVSFVTDHAWTLFLHDYFKAVP